MGDFNASTGTMRDGYETCVGLHGSGTVNQNSTKFLDFARSHGLRVAGSWFQRTQARVVPLCKEKGDCQDCNNYQGLTLLSVPGKVFARIILDRVRHHLLEHQRPEQSGFIPKR